MLKYKIPQVVTLTPNLMVSNNWLLSGAMSRRKFSIYYCVNMDLFNELFGQIIFIEIGTFMFQFLMNQVSGLSIL